jgi:hypothetical protein
MTLSAIVDKIRASGAQAYSDDGGRRKASGETASSACDGGMQTARQLFET